MSTCAHVYMREYNMCTCVIMSNNNVYFIEIESCRTSDCQHRCKETNGGGVECYCNSGYTLDADGKSCNGT